MRLKVSWAQYQAGLKKAIVAIRQSKNMHNLELAKKYALYVLETPHDEIFNFGLMTVPDYYKMIEAYSKTYAQIHKRRINSVHRRITNGR